MQQTARVALRQVGKSKGVCSEVRFLRKAARSAESAAADRGATNMIESALEQANLPLKPGEAIIAAIGLACCHSFLL